MDKQENRGSGMHGCGQVKPPPMNMDRFSSEKKKDRRTSEPGILVTEVYNGACKALKSQKLDKVSTRRQAFIGRNVDSERPLAGTATESVGAGA